MSLAASKRVVFAFAGQGAQRSGMAAALHDGDAVFRSAFTEAAALASELAGDGAVARALHADGASWPDLATSNLALIATAHGLISALAARGVTPDAVLGSSLGELPAWLAAGGCNLDTAMKTALAHARALDAHAPAGDLLAATATPDHCRAVLAANDCTLAGELADGNSLVAGDVEALERCRVHLESAGITAVRLGLAHPYHSPAISAARTAFFAQAPNQGWSRPAIPAWSCTTAEMVAEPSPLAFWNATTGPLRTPAALAGALNGTGALVDLSASPALAPPRIRTRRDLTVLTILEPRSGDLERLALVAERLAPAIAF